MPCEPAQVRISEIEVVDVPSGISVYNLAVPGTENFFANGVLVHNCLIVDDPIKGREQADSETYRENIWDWYAETGRERLLPGGAIIVCQTRWHADDLIGRLLRQDDERKRVGRPRRWTVLRLPAIADEDERWELSDGTVWERKTGEALWPEWFGLDVLQELREDTAGEAGSTRAWNALYQQRPTSDEGGLFKRHWWQRYNLEAMIHRGLRADVIAVDASYGGTEDNDYSVAAVWGALDGRYYLMDLWRDRAENPDVRRKLRDIHAKWRAPLLIEDAANGKILLQDLRRGSGTFDDSYPAIPTIPFDPSGMTKLGRAASVVSLVEGGVVYLPEGAAWMSDLIEEAAAFPHGRHDDQVDAVSIGLARLARGHGAESRPNPFGPQGAYRYGSIAAPGPGSEPWRPWN